jgi:hypothetical protein
MCLRITACRGGRAFLLLAIVCLALAACSTGDTSDTGNGALPFSTTDSSNPSPTATRAVIGPVAVTVTPTVSATTVTLTCAVHSAEGSDDDETQHTLACTVKHAPTTDTQFTLHYGVRDPAGNVHSLAQTCNGSLRNGTGSCSQTYEFIFAFAPAPAPVTGELLPSHSALGPALPSFSSP